MARVRSRVSHRIETLPPSGIRRFFELVERMPEAISLGIGEPDFVTPWRVREAAIFSLERGHTHYTPNRGIGELLAEVARYLQRRFGLEYDPDTELLITIGGSEIGQGPATNMAQIAADILGLPIEAVFVGPTDTDLVQDSGPTVASRTTVMSGNAVIDAAMQIRERMLAVAAAIIGTTPDNVELVDGRMVQSCFIRVLEDVTVCKRSF